MPHHGTVFTHSHTSRRTVIFDTVQLELTAGGRWPEGRWVFLGDGEPLVVGCGDLNEITITDGGLFPVTVVEPGGTHGPFDVQGVITNEPIGAHCMLFTEAENGFWVGTTISTSYGKVVLASYEFDPA